jgi:hypothetical protein
MKSLLPFYRMLCNFLDMYMCLIVFQMLLGGVLLCASAEENILPNRDEVAGGWRKLCT